MILTGLVKFCAGAPAGSEAQTENRETSQCVPSSRRKCMLPSLICLVLSPAYCVAKLRQSVGVSQPGRVAGEHGLHPRPVDVLAAQDHGDAPAPRRSRSFISAASAARRRPRRSCE